MSSLDFKHRKKVRAFKVLAARVGGSHGKVIAIGADARSFAVRRKADELRAAEDQAAKDFKSKLDTYGNIHYSRKIQGTQRLCRPVEKGTPTGQTGSAEKIRLLQT